MIIQRSVDTDITHNVGYCFRLCKQEYGGTIVGYVNNVRRGSWDDLAELQYFNHSVIMEQL